MRKYIRYTQCERETINGHAHVGAWKHDTRKCIVAGPYNANIIDDKLVTIMGLACTMPGSAEIVTNKQAANLNHYAHFNGVPPCSTQNWDETSWAKWDDFVNQEKQREFINLGCPDDMVRRFVESQAKAGNHIIVSDDTRFDGGKLDVRNKPNEQAILEEIWHILVRVRSGHNVMTLPAQFDEAIAFVKNLLPNKG